MSKGFLSHLKDLVVTDDEPKSAMAPVQKQVAATAAPASSVTQVPADASRPSVIDTKALETTLTGMIEQRPEFALYQKFAETAKSMEAAIADEGTRFKAAQAVLKVSSSDLIASIKAGVAVLGTEAENFNGSFVASAEAQILTAKDQLAAVAQETADLMKKLSELTDKKAEISASITNQTSDLGKAKIDFAAVSKTVGDRYVDLWQKIEQHLGTTTQAGTQDAK